MKNLLNHRSYRIAIASVHLLTALTVLCVTQNALAFFAVSAVNPLVTSSLGVSYSKINVANVAYFDSLTAKDKEELWVKRVLMGADRENVFSDNMIGGPGSGKPFIQ